VWEVFAKFHYAMANDGVSASCLGLLKRKSELKKEANFTLRLNGT
jgi:hypothetical protein